MTATASATHVTALVIKRTLKAGRDKVFAAFIDPARLARWMGPGPDWSCPRVEVEAKVGGRYLVVMREPGGSDHSVSGEFLEILPPERLVYSWAWASTPDDVSRVTIDLAEIDGGGTRLTLTHDRFSDVTVRDRHGVGWNGCLDRLEGAAH